MLLTTENIKDILTQLGFPQKNITDLTAITILALSNTTPRSGLIKGKSCLADGSRITDILEFARTDLGLSYAENTRETIRKHSLKYLVDFNLAIVNADDPSRSTNSGLTNYILIDSFKQLLVAYNNDKSLFNTMKNRFMDTGRIRRLGQINSFQNSPNISISVPQSGKILKLSPGEHNLIQKIIIEELFPLSSHSCYLIYVGDTKNKNLFIEESLCENINLTIDSHEKLPDVIGFDTINKAVLIFEAVASSGPVDILRQKELVNIFKDCPYPLKAYSVFLHSKVYQKFSTNIAPGTAAIILESKSFISYSVY